MSWATYLGGVFDLVGDNSDSSDDDAKNASGSSSYTEHNDIRSEQLKAFQDVRILANKGSSREENPQDLLESISPQKRWKRQRQSSDTEPRSRKKRSLSQSPSLDWDSDNGIDTPNISEDSGNKLSSSRPESASEVDWESYLCEDEMLPPSNWEAEFLEHRAEEMDHYSYKGLIQDEEQPGSGDGEDEPWYPYDPEDMLNQDFESEMDGISFTGGLEGQNIICYGMIHKVRVKVLPQAPEFLGRLQIAQANSETLEQQDIYVFEVRCEGDGQKFLLQLPETVGEEIQPFDNIAVLNRESSSVLSHIASLCTFTAYSRVEPWISIANETTMIGKGTCILIDVVIYGRQEHCEEVGGILDTMKVYLQEPDHRDASLGYQNPHFMDLSAVHLRENTDLNPLGSSLLQTDVDVQPQPSDEQVATQALLKQEVAAVFKAMTRAQNLKRITADVRVRTPLLPRYQEEALDFITQRETGPIPEEYSLWKPKDSTSYTHVITGCEENEIPIETGGGILADEMGLGKTLTMLSAIIRTADEAKAFAFSFQDDAHLSVEHTLIPSRATLVVVPSPSHIIRRMTTKLFKAIKRLRTALRWCLTGTPIQNSLEDLAALVNFTRSSPLDNLHTFKKHIILPLMKRSVNGLENLRQLLDSVCLRRTKQLLDLPKVILEDRSLTFSVREKKQYVDTRDKLIKMINQHRLQPQNRGYSGVFQLQLQLRRLCNHGTFQKHSLGIDEFDPEQAIAFLKKQKQARCEVCGINITGVQGIEEQRSGSFTTCGHLLCPKCVPKMKQALQKIDGRDGCLKCSLCPETIFGEYLVTEDASSKLSKNGSKHLSTWQYFDKGGCSTKVSALVADIEQHKTEGKRQVHPSVT
ncbi:hypothetical protein FGG08_005341 [Glutinoglossum americanum]|uniref:RING-type domain-containing protein n=1 Tax=Glutinoglossum americanum TaxID=1670608 RepID=A0A9P8I7E5_9PEZI|nr:hypothetical protein FGG08_005341 [Glutinoglossum americanum]